MTIERRLKLTTGVLILFVLVTVSILFWSSRQVERGLKAIETSAQAVQSAFVMSNLMDDFVNHGRTRYLRQWEKHNESLGKILNDETIAESMDQDLLDDLKSRYQAVNHLYTRVREMTVSAEGRDQSRDANAKEMVASLMSLQLEQLVTAANDLSNATQSRTLKRRHFVQQLIVALGVSLVFIILINLYLIRKSVVYPLKMLSTGAERIGLGDFDYVTEIRSHDEVGKLAQAFNTMIDGLQERTAALKRAHDELELRVTERTEELRVANQELKEEIERHEQTERALVESEEKFRSIFENSIDALLLTSPSDGRILAANSAACRVFGYSEEELRELDRDGIVDSNDPRLAEGLEKRKQFGSFLGELNLKRKDGTVFPAEVSAAIFHDAAGEARSAAVIRDVTARKGAEEQLRESEERYRQMFQKTWAVKLLIDPDSGDILDANQAASEFYGYALDRLKQQKIVDINMLSREEVFDEMSKAHSEQKNYFQFQHRLASGAIRYVEVYSSPLSVHGRKLLYSIVHDITDRHKAQEDLIRSNEDLQQFAYVASHDLQEPLRNVAGCLQLLEKKCGNKLGPEADQLIQYAVESATRMKDLIRDLLLFSRVSTKGKRPQLTDCREVLQQALSNLRSTIRETGGVITHDSLPTVTADPSQLIQAFQNLISNALKFHGPQTPKIHVSAVRDGREWVFSVKDNGIGIESRQLERIFVIFQRLHKRTEYEGTGMGLAIVKKIVERHGGRIWVESEPGKGTTFYFAMPVQQSHT